jgi:AhpD family alkylhydroperoxidase
VPNVGAVLSFSLPLTRGLPAFDAALDQGLFSGAVAEQLAIAVSQESRCAYCLAAHSAAARTAQGSDPSPAAALRFAQQLVRMRGQVKKRADRLSGSGLRIR